LPQFFCALRDPCRGGAAYVLASNAEPHPKLEYDMKRYLIALALLAGASSVAQAHCVGCSASGGTVFNGISLNGLTLNGARLNGLTLNGWSLNGIQLNGVQFNGWTLNGLQLNGVQFNGWTLNGLQFNGVQFNGTPAQAFDAQRAGATDWSAVPLNQVQVRLPAAR
jgi:uncharacterized protein YjbI with pentapeptide repeats